MTAAEIIKELPKLTEAERQVVLNRLRDLSQQLQDLRINDAAADEQASERDRLEDQSLAYRTVDLRPLGIDATQAADLRARQKTFAEDWERPEASIYDEDPAR